LLVCLQDLLPNCFASVGCLQHCINLALKDFAKQECLAGTISQASDLVTYITGRTATRAIYDEMKADLDGTALIKAGGTRFGTNVLSMESLEQNE
jgi:hypothetical protein